MAFCLENCVSSYAGTEQEKDVYWYHPDHLGSSSFITGLDGEVTQSIDYFPSGEVFVENHKNSYNTPYKFNGKEQDSETGYYYYGARYYNPRVSLWLSVDPLADYNPFYNSEHYIDGQHNGGVYNSGNLNPYIYCYQSPVMYVDPNGKQTLSPYIGYGSGGGKIEDLQKAGEYIGRFFKGAGNFFVDSYNSAKWSISTTYKANWGTSSEMALARNELLNNSFATGQYIASGKAFTDALNALKTPEGLGYATAFIGTFYLTKKLTANIGTGSLVVGEGSFSVSELNAARYMASRGSNVVLRDVIQGGALGRTSDLLVDGLTYDVYTPTTNNANRIISAIASKNKQAQGIVLDLSKTSVKASDLGNVVKRVQGAGATNIKNVVIMPK